jgi:hypothetical protein
VGDNMGIIKRVKAFFSESEKKESWNVVRIVPCQYNDCIYHYIYNIPIVEMVYGQFPLALAACLFCVRLNRSHDMFHKK